VSVKHPEDSFVRTSYTTPKALARSPILWGALATAAFYGLLYAGVINSQFVQRYFASHPVEYVTAGLFFVGMAALAIKALDVNRQFNRPSARLLEPFSPGSQRVSECDSLLGEIDRLPAERQHDYRVRRIRDALQYVRQSGTADGLEDELKYLSDTNGARAHADYGLVRTVIWAMPMLGFLGTVIGITLAVGKLLPKSLEDSLPVVISGLSVAFDTTALAIGLTIVVFFAMFLTHRKEDRLLEQVEREVNREMVGRFERIAAGLSGEVAAVRHMTDAVIQSTEKMVHRQAEIWRNTISASESQWSRAAEETGKQLQSALSIALGEGLKAHAKELSAAQREAADSNRQHWERVRQSMVTGSEISAGLQRGMNTQAGLLGRAVEAVGDIKKLEIELNRNLSALAGAKNFEETVMSLAAAIHLLNSRLGHLPADGPRVQLDADARKGHAA
jgi:biopolymer transport protein ExbB/TolQ